jgi:hypothetical protein
MNMPTKGYKEILLKILDVIEYKDDKEDFTNQFAIIIYSQSLIDLVQSLLASDQEKIKQELSASDNSPEKIEEIIKRCFTEEQRKKALEIAAKNVMVNFIAAIQDTLSPLQGQNLLNLSQEFSPTA